MDLAVGAAPEDGRHRPVLVSHGMAGSPMTYRMLPHHLAAHGVVVGLPEHPYNHRFDDSLAGPADALSRRPRHVRTAADRFSEGDRFSLCPNAESSSVVGHPLGGYTALAVAGGAPVSLAHDSAIGRPRRFDAEPDPRVKTLVRLAPPTPWFRSTGSLGGVGSPILMLSGDKDEPCPQASMPRIVVDGVPAGTKVESRLVENARHCPFLSPWPDRLQPPAFPPSQDPTRFDRARFMAALNAEVLDFPEREA